MEPQLVLAMISSITFLLLVKMYIERGFSLNSKERKKGVH